MLHLDHRCDLGKTDLPRDVVVISTIEVLVKIVDAVDVTCNGQSSLAKTITYTNRISALSDICRRYKRHACFCNCIFALSAWRMQ